MQKNGKSFPLLRSQIYLFNLNIKKKKIKVYSLINKKEALELGKSNLSTYQVILKETVKLLRALIKARKWKSTTKINLMDFVPWGPSTTNHCAAKLKQAKIT